MLWYSMAANQRKRFNQHKYNTYISYRLLFGREPDSVQHLRAIAQECKDSTKYAERASK